MLDVVGRPDHRFGLDPKQAFYAIFAGTDALQGKMPAEEVFLDVLADDMAGAATRVLMEVDGLPELRAAAREVLEASVQRLRSVTVLRHPLRVEFETADDEGSYSYCIAFEGVRHG